MTHVLKGELLKLRTTRTALGFAVALAVLVLALVLIKTFATDPTTLDEKREVISTGGPLAALMLVFGVVGAAGDFRHRTLAAALLVVPDRGRVTAARVLAYGLVAALIGALAMSAVLAIAALVLSGADGPSLTGETYLRAWSGGVLALALCAMIGVGAGVLVGNQVVGVIGALVWTLVFEPLVSLISLEAGKYTITGASTGLGGLVAENLPGFGLGLAILAVWALVFAVLGVLVDRRREVR